MDDATTADKDLRGVGVSEGPLHMVGAGATLVLLGLPFRDQRALAVMAVAAGCWIFAYAVLRVARVRTWFGAWDAVSFGFVWSSAAVLALLGQGLLIRLG
jgi:tellurite resistance protein TehA-like permease